MMWNLSELSRIAARNEGRDSHDAPDLGRKLVCSRPYFAEEDVVIEMSKFRCKAAELVMSGGDLHSGAGAGSAVLALTMDNPVKETARTAAAANFLSAECFIVFLPFCYGFLLRRPTRNLSMKKMQSFLCIHYTAIKLQLKIVIFHGSLFSFCIPLDR